MKRYENIVNFVNKKNNIIKISFPKGNEIKSYNLERTICDIVKNENKCGLDIEQRNKIIRHSFINGNINGTTIIQYAKKLKCEKKIKAIMEVMI
jgi:hypothetical protein